MGNRLSKIVTRTGDDGTTGLGDGSRVSKIHQRINCIGTIDELNAALGVTISQLSDNSLSKQLLTVQHQLFELGAELCLPGEIRISDELITNMEKQLEEINEELIPLKEFILPGGSLAASYCHVARTICRRAERDLIYLSETEKNANPISIKYVNRLSDFLFVIARCINKSHHRSDVFWKPDSQDIGTK